MDVPHGRASGRLWGDRLNDRIFIGSGDGRLYAIQLKTGKQLWRFEAGGAIVGSPAVAGGRLVIGTDAGDLYCLGAK